MSLHLSACSDTDTMTLNGFIRDSDNKTLVSAGEVFQLGFFTPDGSSDDRRYVGIWYCKCQKRYVVWVANRDRSLFNTAGSFRLTKDGELKLLDENNNTEYWSSGVGGRRSNPSKTKRKVTLMDSGNLVLSEEGEAGGSRRVLWQSFDHPTHTFLPGMKMEMGMKLTSWRSKTDPGRGHFTFQLDPKSDNRYAIQNSGKPFWKSLVFGDLFTSGGGDDITRIVPYLISNFTGSTRGQLAFGNENRTSMLNFSTYFKQEYNDTRLVLNSDGKIQLLRWQDNTSVWKTIRSEPSGFCDTFKVCGDFGSCNSKNRIPCKCLPGYEPKSLNNWKSGDFSQGCQRKFQVCSGDVKIDNFLSLKMMKVGGGDGFEVHNEKECREKCLGECQCQAYAYVKNTTRESSRCWNWLGELSNIQEYIDEDHIIYIRVAPSAIGKIYFI